MSFNALAQIYLPAIELELQRVVNTTRRDDLEELWMMLAYHMGWEGEGAGPEARGKRIRPLMALLAAAGCGGAWETALPAAAAVELLHNFSLIHDDIEDNSPLRRGRATVWAKWGIPQAVNAGDAMFVMAQMALLDLEAPTDAVTTTRAMGLFQQTCLALTQGQYLDISYETRSEITLQDYWTMVGGKTAALLACCVELGAIAAGAPEAVCEAYASFGRSLGLAFQIQDDMLGIWGDAALTGKSAESDLLSGKKSLPVLYGLEVNGPFARRWRAGRLTADEVGELADQLAQEGGLAYTEEKAQAMTQRAVASLELANPQGEAGEALAELAERLLKRNA